MMILLSKASGCPPIRYRSTFPGFAHLRVYKGTTAAAQMILDDSEHAPNAAAVMSDSAGFSYGIFDNMPVDKMYHDQNLLESQNLEEMIDKAREKFRWHTRRERPGDTASRCIDGNIVEKLWGGEFRILWRITSFRGSV